MLTVNWVAKYLQTSIVYVRKMCQRGELNARKVGRDWVVLESEDTLKQWMENPKRRVYEMNIRKARRAELKAKRQKNAERLVAFNKERARKRREQEEEQLIDLELTTRGTIKGL